MNKKFSKNSGDDKDKVNVRGRVQTVKHHNEDSGFSIITVKCNTTGNIHTCAGVTGPVHVSETAHIEGKITNHPKFGQQIKIFGATITPPELAQDIEKYLCSGLIKGIGPKTAKLIVGMFGENSILVINQDPDLLADIRGIGKSKIKVIKAAWEAHREISAIMQFLIQRGIGTQRAYAIYKAYKDKSGGAFKVLRENPYDLTKDVRGIGFKLADQIAKTLNFTQNDPRRIRAGIQYVLEVETSKGSCGLPINDFISTAADLLGVRLNEVEQMMYSEIEANNIIQDKIGITQCVFTPRMHQAESDIAQYLKNLMQTDIPWKSFSVENEISRVEQETGRCLSKSQKAAVSTSLSEKVSIITGGPGVGKTTTLDTLLKVIQKYVDKKFIRLAAPAGKAAKRMTAQTGLEAMTIHRLIGYGARRTSADEDPTADQIQSDTNSTDQNSQKRPQDNLAECKLLVLDESSMIDVRLLQALLNAIRFEKSSTGEPQLRKYMPALILVGDVDQIPSVGAGAVLRDLIESEALPVSRLTEIFRQAASSKIITNAHRINSGLPPINANRGEKTDFYFWPYEKPNESYGEITLTSSIAKEIVEIATTRLPNSLKLNPKTDVQILAPMKNGDLGTNNLNKQMQEKLNPLREGNPHVMWNNWDFRIDDRVMQITNNYDKNVFNGSQGYVQSITPEQKTLTVLYDGEIIEYEFEELDQLMPAYAITIHKSQGSEYPAVIIPIVNAHYMMLNRNIVYTAVTRGKSMVVLMGQNSAINRAVKNDSQSNRWTRLRELMMENRYHPLMTP